MPDEVKDTTPAAENLQDEEAARLYKDEVERVRTNWKGRADEIRESLRVSDRDLQVVINARG